MSQREDKAAAYRVAVIGYDEPFIVPDWLEGEFSTAGIECVASNCHTPEEVIAIGHDKDVLLTSSSRKLLTRHVIEQLSACRALVRVGSGVDCIDIAAATDHGILVVNTPGALAEEVAEHALALLLACVRRLTLQDRLVRKGRWDSRAMATEQRVRRKILGLVGLGRIARALLEQTSGLNLTYLAHDPYIDPSLADQWRVKLVSLDELLAQADIVSLHVPLTETTHHLIGERELRSMKRHAILINTARGAILDQKALHLALSEGWIAGAGLDVLDPEPPSPDEPLLQLENVILSPHSAAFSYEIRDAMYKAGYKAALDILDKNWPTSVVNPGVQTWWTPGEK